MFLYSSSLWEEKTDGNTVEVCLHTAIPWFSPPLLSRRGTDQQTAALTHTHTHYHSVVFLLCRHLSDNTEDVFRPILFTPSLLPLLATVRDHF